MVYWFNNRNKAPEDALQVTVFYSRARPGSQCPVDKGRGEWIHEEKQILIILNNLNIFLYNIFTKYNYVFYVYYIYISIMFFL